MNERHAQPRQVLVTGSAGAIGRPVCNWLRQRGYAVRGFDRRSTDGLEGLEDFVVGDLGDRDKVRAAVEGMDTVIHLAACVDDADFVDDLLESNVKGSFHVFDAARQFGVERVVVASSLQAVEGYGWDGPTIRVEDGPSPTNHYGLTKVWAETMGEMYARCYGLSVVSVRIGWLPRDPADAKRLDGHPIGPNVYLSHDDAKRFFEHCIESPTPQPSESAIVFATSRPRDRKILDLEPAVRILGYEPLDTWPEGLLFAV